MTNGTVNIHGKEYKTVALRVSEFRESYPLSDGWAITTEIVEANDAVVIMKASVLSRDVVVGTGFAEEKRNSTNINTTSALENCETSAIGRALAACGFAGTEYASANEVESAIAARNEPEDSVSALVQKAKDAAEREDWYALCCLNARSDREWLDAWGKLGPNKKRINELIDRRTEYKNSLIRLAEAEDLSGFAELVEELKTAEARYIYSLLDDEKKAQEFMIQLMQKRPDAKKEAA